MKSIIIFAVLFISVAAFSANQIPIPYQVDELPSSITVSVSKDQHIKLRLPSCFSCGYGWRVVTPSDIQVKYSDELNYPGVVEVEDSGPRSAFASGIQIQVIDFALLPVGQYDIKIDYGRPSGVAVKTLNLKLDVQ